jgi:hypothetical protein
MHFLPQERAELQSRELAALAEKVRRGGCFDRG